MRLIDADALKDKLQQHHDFYVMSWGGFGKMPIGEKKRVDEITNCIAEVVNAPTIEPRPKGRWIPCSERMPDKGLRVLMYLNNAWQIVGWYDIEDKRWYALPYEEPIDEFTYAKVIAWMPLHEYKGKD